MSIPTPPAFQPIAQQGEAFLWTGQPNKLVFIFSGFVFLVFGILWGVFDFVFFRVSPSKLHHLTSADQIGIIFILAHSLPCWMSILNMLRLVLSWKNTVYAITDRRLIVRSGMWGIDYDSIDYDKISDIAVNVSPLASLCNVGTVIALPNQVVNGLSFIGIARPYEMYKKMKEVALNVKTDWSYPNALRPDANPGYKTTYRAD